MIAINNLTISFGGRYLFDGISFNINPNDRIGLIGRNGTGKSTLLKIISNHLKPEQGTVSMPKDYEIGYLQQEGNLDSDKNVFDEMRTSVEHILSIEAKIQAITDQIAKRTDYDTKEYASLLNELTIENDRFKLLGGLSIEAEIEKILLGLGFERNEFDKMCYEFSGGWQMRIELAKLLLRKPHILLLDEPTNHLDIESIQWFENYLRSYFGAVVIVSHDRNFLNTVTNRTIEIASGKIYDMAVSFDEFIALRNEQRKSELNAFKNQQKQIKETQKFIDRFRYKATLATRVQSKIKMLEKIDLIETEEVDNSRIELKFPEPPRSGRVVIEAEKLSKSYGNKLVIDSIDFVIERGDKIAFVGKNGEGKSTLSKILAGIETHQGHLSRGLNVAIGYYAQHQAELLYSEDTVFDVIDKAATGEMRKHIRTLLGAFLFSGDDVYKKVKVLSGGEKSRLALAKMLLLPVNLLILDEPTNHLDLPAKDVLKNALIKYQGALVLVSHDREFLDGITNKTVYFKDRKIKEFLGGIYDFLAKHKIETLNELEINKVCSSVEETKTIGKDKMAYTIQKQKQKEANKLKRLINVCEDEISQLEANIEELEANFSNLDFFKDIQSANEHMDRYNNLRKQLEIKMQEWEQLHSDIEGF